MKTLMRSLLVVGAVMTFVGCSSTKVQPLSGEGSNQGGAAVGNHVTPNGSGATSVGGAGQVDLGTSPNALTVEIRAQGVNLKGASAVFVAVKDLKAWAGNKPLPITLADSDINLANANQAWLLGNVLVPTDAKDVRFEVQFDDYGAYQFPGVAGDIAMKQTPVSWTAPLSYLQRNGHTVMAVDVGSSLVPARNGERLFLPSLAVHY